MSKERRLGRGLEALLGQVLARNESTMPPPQPRPATPPEANDEPQVAQFSVPPAPSAVPTDPLFRLDVPHTGLAQMGPPHHLGGSAPMSSEAAIPVPAIGDPPTTPSEPEPRMPTRVSVDEIDRNPAQPRQDFPADEMRALSESLAAHGLLQPVVVRRMHDRYQLVAGERRLRAAVQAGWVDVPVNVIEADDRQMAELAIVENLQRKDLNALEKAASFQKYLDEYGCTQEELAGRLKLDRSTIANLIRLLELPEAVQDALRRGRITQGHARALLPLGDEQEQIEFCQRIQREGMNVRQTEALVQQIIDAADREPLATAEAPARPSRSSRTKSEHIVALEQQFRTALGMKVKITHNARGRGKLVVQFRDHEEFDRLKKHICGG